MFTMGHFTSPATGCQMGWTYSPIQKQKSILAQGKRHHAGCNWRLGSPIPTRKFFRSVLAQSSQVLALRPGPRSGGESTAAVGATGTAEAVKPWRSRYRSPPPRQPCRRWRSGSGRSSTPMTSPPSGRRSTSYELARSPSHPPIPSSPEWFRCSDSSVLLLRLSVAVPSVRIEIFLGIFLDRFRRFWG